MEHSIDDPIVLIGSQKFVVDRDFTVWYAVRLLAALVAYSWGRRTIRRMDRLTSPRRRLLKRGEKMEFYTPVWVGDDPVPRLRPS